MLPTYLRILLAIMRLLFQHVYYLDSLLCYWLGPHRRFCSGVFLLGSFSVPCCSDLTDVPVSFTRITQTLLFQYL